MPGRLNLFLQNAPTFIEDITLTDLTGSHPCPNLLGISQNVGERCNSRTTTGCRWLSDTQKKHLTPQAGRCSLGLGCRDGEGIIHNKQYTVQTDRKRAHQGHYDCLLVELRIKQRSSSERAENERATNEKQKKQKNKKKNGYDNLIHHFFLTIWIRVRAGRVGGRRGAIKSIDGSSRTPRTSSVETKPHSRDEDDTATINIYLLCRNTETYTGGNGLPTKSL